jgi:hypothetical protein
MGELSVLLDLQALAERRFGALKEAECRLLRAAPQGKIANCGPDEASHEASENDQTDWCSWEPSRTIRASVLEWLCADSSAGEQLHHSGIRVRAAQIEGRLNLSFVTVRFPLTFLPTHIY